MKRPIPSLKQYLSLLSREEKQQFIAKVGTTIGYLYQLTSGAKEPSWKMAFDINANSNGKVPLQDLRPDLWRYYIGVKNEISISVLNKVVQDL